MAEKFTNSLIHQKSPYLLQHAHNPVDWVAWDNTHLEKAAQEQQLLIISIGYASCHWCHVMEKECFEDATVAQLMNQHFISIKVDREERPDVDQLYMDALQLITGSGGWPLNIVALPDGRPLWGCTYLPKEQWMEALKKIVRLQTVDPKQLATYGEQMLGYLSTSLYPTSASNDLKIDIETVKKRILHASDPKYGGFNAPKFMMPVLIDTFLKLGLWEKDSACQTHAHTTLRSIALGGIHDTVEGGLSRYSVDHKWHIPHFEKMTYDNGLALNTFCTAYRMEQNPLYEEVITGILDFASNWLVDRSGGFYSAVDADSLNAEGVNEEGAYYYWDKATLKDSLKEEYKYFAAYYNINAEGHWENENYVLLRKAAPEAVAVANKIPLVYFLAKEKKWKNKLRALRLKRQRPATDTKILCSWNAMLTQGLLATYRTLENEKALVLALQNFNFIFSNYVESSGKLYRYVYEKEHKTPGFLEDYAFLIRACIYCYETVFESEWLTKAKMLLTYCLKHFKANNSPLLYFTAAEENSLLVRKIDCEDNVIPSANAVMAENLLRLSVHFDAPHWEAQAKAMLAVMRTKAEEHPKAYSLWVALLAEQQQKQKELVIVGPKYRSYFKKVHRLEIPHLRLAGSAVAAPLPLLKNRYQKGATVLYLCEDKHCQLPTIKLNEILAQLNPK